MPVYAFSCPKCGWSGDLLVTADERDDQRCVHRTTPADPTPCDAPLDREEICLSARMDYNWGNWR